MSKKVVVIGASDRDSDWIKHATPGAQERDLAAHDYVEAKLKSRSTKPDKKSGTGEKPKRRT